MKSPKTMMIIGVMIIFFAGCGAREDILPTQTVECSSLSNDENMNYEFDEYDSSEQIRQTDDDLGDGSNAGAEDAAVVDYPPCIMVNGIVYQSTGYKSSTIGCGNMDGEIKTMVDGSELPSENDQSNFGTGIAYQYGTDDRILVNMDGELIIFRDRDSTDTNIPPEVLHFIARIKEIRDQDMVVSVVEIPPLFMFDKGDYIISMENIDDNVSVGDYVMVWCDDSVEETSPANLTCIYSAYKINQDPEDERGFIDLLSDK